MVEILAAQNQHAVETENRNIEKDLRAQLQQTIVNINQGKEGPQSGVQIDVAAMDAAILPPSILYPLLKSSNGNGNGNGNGNNGNDGNGKHDPDGA